MVDPTAIAPALDRPVVFDQVWCDLAFLHWPVDPADVAQFMPRGVRPDTVDGVTYVGLVPFRMRSAGLFRNRPVPYLGSFLEVNVRLYSVDDQGRHGIVFRSLDCNRLPVATAARVINVPYVYSRITAAGYPRAGRYDIPDLPVGQRRWWTVQRRRGARSHVALTIGERVEPTPLEVFLSARWGMHSRYAGRTLWTPNHHASWELHAVSDLEVHDDLVAAAGVHPVGPMLRPLWSPGVRARFGLPFPVSRPLAAREPVGPRVTSRAS